MARKVKIPPVRKGTRPRRPPPPLYIGAWLRKLGLKQVNVAKAARIGESHLSLIIKGERYPSAGAAEDIASAMKIPLETLKRAPPDEATIRAAADIDPEILVLLGKNLLKK